MPQFLAGDGVTLGYRTSGAGPPLVCLPGGPGQGSSYLDDLGGLTASRTLVRLDTRGTGASARPADPGSYRVDRQVADVEALCTDLGADQVDVFAHSAGGGLGLLHAAAHPGRIRRLVLCAPSPRVLGPTEDPGSDAALAARAGEPWYAEASAALTAEPEDWAGLLALRYASAPFLYGRWDETTRAHAARDAHDLCREAHEGWYAGFEPDPAVPDRLSRLVAPVLVVGGAFDFWPSPGRVRELAAGFRTGTAAVLDGAGHFPWVDTPDAFRDTVAAFLR